MKQNNWIKLEFPSNSINVALARATVAFFASQLDLTLDQLEDIKVAVSEAVSNCVIHGYGEQSGDIIVQAKYENKQLKISIEDYGRGIADIGKVQETGFTTVPEERMGLGFTFMHEYMDQVLLSSKVDEGTKVIMIKDVPQNNNAVDDNDPPSDD